MAVWRPQVGALPAKEGVPLEDGGWPAPVEDSGGDDVHANFVGWGGGSGEGEGGCCCFCKALRGCDCVEAVV